MQKGVLPGRGKLSEAREIRQYLMRRRKLPLTVMLSSTLRSFVPGYDPGGGVALKVEAGISVAEVCRLMNVPHDRVKIVMVNGRHRSMDHLLAGDERVALFPPVGGG
jgi:molybdopterin synthase sulfur carrier subunit